MDDEELARRSVASFGELLAALGRWGGGAAAEVRRPDAVGARIGSLADNPWFDAVVVPYDSAPPADGPDLPSCVWTLADRVEGRVEDTTIVTPCMGLVLADAALPATGDVVVVSPSLAVVGAANDRAYDSPPALAPLAELLDDPRVRTHGVEVDGVPVCVAMTLALGDDLGVHYVATEAAHRRRGLATRLLLAVLAEARVDGFATATLQASPDGRPVYRRMGFREVGLLHGFLRPGAVDRSD